MHGNTTPRRRRTIRWTIVGFAIAAAGLTATQAFAQLALRNATVTNGASSSVSAGDYKLSATIGEPIAGIAAGTGGLVVHAGFQATFASTTTTDQLFAGGFED
jgi:hypothetical protein